MYFIHIPGTEEDRATVAWAIVRALAGRKGGYDSVSTTSIDKERQRVPAGEDLLHDERAHFNWLSGRNHELAANVQSWGTRRQAIYARHWGW